MKTPKDKYKEVHDYILEHPDDSGIIYCLTRKLVEEVCGKLIRDGITATRYHAGLSDEERRNNQDDFIYDRCRVMVATNAFGMGIDKSDVRYVIHYNMPKNMEGYYQEAVRAVTAILRNVSCFTAGRMWLPISILSREDRITRKWKRQPGALSGSVIRRG